MSVAPLPDDQPFFRRKRRSPGAPEPVHFTEWTEVTPALCTSWLENNANNRNPQENKIDKLARAADNDDYRVSWDMFAFSEKDGRMLNGQNRARAIIKSGKTVWAYVLYNCPDDAQETGDRSAPRTLAQTLSMQGYTDTNTLQAAIFFCMHYEDGTLPSDSGYDTPEALRWFADNQGLRTLLPQAARWYRDCPGMSRSTILALAYLFATQSDADAVEPFFQTLSTGLEMKANSPIYRLRGALENVAKSPKKTNQKTMAAWTIKAWNNYIKNLKGPQIYIWRQSIEDFPTIDA